MNKEFKNIVLGSVSVITKNSNHNSGFEGPRLVNGVLTSSDKCLKYYVRNFLRSNGEKIFYTKTLNIKTGKPNSILDRCFNLNIKTLANYFEYLDNKLFGFTILTDKKDNPNGNFRAPTIIPYGENIFKENNYTIHAITSQFANNSSASATAGEEKDMTTIGSEHKVNEANYLHTFKMYPKNLERDIMMTNQIFENNIPYITHDEVEKMKYAFSHCIGSSVDGSYGSSSKSGTSIGLVVYVTLKEDVKINISLNKTISCVGYNEYDLSNLFERVEKYKKYIEKVDIAYTEGDVVILTPIPTDSIYNVSECGYIINQ